MRKLLAALILSLAIESQASEQYIYPPGNDSPIQHWSYPTLAAMNTDTGLYGQDVFKIAFNKGDGNFYYLADPAGPTWVTFGGGGGSGNVSTSGSPSVDQTSVWVDGTHIKGVTTLRGGLDNTYYLKKFSGADYDWGWAQVTAGSGNVSNVGTPSLDQTAVWTDATHVKGVNTLSGGTGGQVLTKIDASPYNYNWATAPGGGGGGTITNIATTAPILGGPITVTGTISLDPTSKSNWDTAFTNNLRWDGGATSLVAATGRTSLGLGTAAVLNVGSGVEAWDADLDQLAALTGTNTIYYRSATGWAQVLMGTGMSFAGGTLSTTAGGGSGIGDFSTNTSLSVANEIVLFADTGGKLGKRSTGSGIATLASGVLGTITDNSANWNTASAQSRQWDGGGGAWLTPATARTTLQLDQVTNDRQTQSAIMPNTLPGTGAVPVGNGVATAYVPRAISGSGANISLSATGVLTISSIANNSLAFSSMTIAGDNISLGGSLTMDQITNVSTAGYLKHTAAANTITGVASIPIADLAASFMTIAGNTVNLGGGVTLDAITGVAANGYLKRTLANNLVNVLSIPNTDLAGNTSGWDTAVTQGRQWDGGGGAWLNPVTARTTLQLNSVTNDTQTQAAIVPNTVPTDGQMLIGSTTLGRYAPRAMTGDVSISATGVTTLNALGNVTNDVQTKAAIVPNTVPTDGQLLVGSTSASKYIPRAMSGDVTMTTAGATTVQNVANGSLVGNGTMTISGTAVALGGAITRDTVIGVAANGLIKRTAAQTYAVAVAGTDYKTGSQPSVNVLVVGVTTTYNVPAAATAVYIEAVGGGGGGGGINCSTNSAYAGGGGGGGGGGYAGTYINNPATSYAITIGGGGGGGSGNSNGNAGGNTTVGTVLTAGGGGGGGAGNGGFYMGQTTANGGNGGVGVTGAFLGGGNDGGVGSSSATQFVAPSSFGAAGIGGGGGGSQFGGGARPLLPTNNGNPGSLFGGGGSGASVTGVASRNGGAGAQGVVRIWEFY